jgi:serralysin
MSRAGREPFDDDDIWFQPGQGDASAASRGASAARAAQNPLNTIDFHFVQAGAPNIKVFFAGADQTFDGVTAERGWSAGERGAAMAAFATYSAATPLRFTIVKSAAAADIVLSLASLEDDVLGQMHTVRGVGYGAFNLDGRGWTGTGLKKGGEGFVTLVHEIGHALGLAHPHDRGGGSQIMAGVTGPFGSYGKYDLNHCFWDEGARLANGDVAGPADHPAPRSTSVIGSLPSQVRASATPAVCCARAPGPVINSNSTLGCAGSAK